MALDAPEVMQVGEELVDRQAQFGTVANQVRGVLEQAAAPWSHLADASVATSSSSSQFHWNHRPRSSTASRLGTAKGEIPGTEPGRTLHRALRG